MLHAGTQCICSCKLSSPGCPEGGAPRPAAARPSPAAAPRGPGPRSRTCPGCRRPPAASQWPAHSRWRWLEVVETVWLNACSGGSSSRCGHVQTACGHRGWWARCQGGGTGTHVWREDGRDGGLEGDGGLEAVEDDVRSVVLRLQDLLCQIARLQRGCTLADYACHPGAPRRRQGCPGVQLCGHVQGSGAVVVGQTCRRPRRQGRRTTAHAAGSAGWSH